MMKNFQTADLCDKFPDLASCVTDFKLFGLRKRFYGKIRTVRCHLDNVLIQQLVNMPSNGEVLVIDGHGSRLTALMGDRLAQTAMNNGWAGIIIYGAIRDSVAINEMDFGIKALGTNPKKSAKVGIGEVDISVSFGNVVFTPNHYLYSDEDGIIVSESALL
ncbi:RraA family [Actinobacillus ureae ATCC 25976]|uniref:4-hydroxy-4-methyl-2-oxoglutarate aldolase n=2 Tax=Actinobacillus ureae TaxID=723 RepID=E8KFQ9_9PAST|nr:RraA family [Actinobacillus ureae ATCC 25976]